MKKYHSIIACTSMDTLQTGSQLNEVHQAKITWRWLWLRKTTVTEYNTVDIHCRGTRPHSARVADGNVITDKSIIK